MLVKNITDKGSPKPIGIGNTVIMPGETAEIPEEVAYVDEFDKLGHKTGKKIIFPSIILLEGMNYITYTETKKAEPKKVEEPVEANVEEVPVVEKPKRTRAKKTV